MGLLFLGFGGYFFYDASIGYPEKNKNFCVYKTFVDAGREFNPAEFTPLSWKTHIESKTIDFSNLPLPAEIDRNATPWPTCLADYNALNTRGWSGLWTQYSEENHLPYKVSEHPFEAGKINEQWIAGSVCILIFWVCIFLLLRTISRRMSIAGTSITAAGKTFDASDISLIDMRKWKNKGLARATVRFNGKETGVRFDGLSYGGFDENDKPNTAEDFMKSLLSVYKGEILDYEESHETEKQPDHAPSSDKAIG